MGRVSGNIPAGGQPANTQVHRSFYDEVGGHETFEKLTSVFYREVAADEILRPMYPEEDLGPAERRLRMFLEQYWGCLLYTSPSPRDRTRSRMPSSA